MIIKMKPFEIAMSLMLSGASVIFTSIFLTEHFQNRQLLEIGYFGMFLSLCGFLVLIAVEIEQFFSKE